MTSLEKVRFRATEVARVLYPVEGSELVRIARRLQQLAHIEATVMEYQRSVRISVQADLYPADQKNNP